MRALHRFLPFLHAWSWVQFFGNHWTIESCPCGDHRMTEAA